MVLSHFLITEHVLHGMGSGDVAIYIDCRAIVHGVEARRFVYVAFTKDRDSAQSSPLRGPGISQTHPQT